MKVFAKNVRLKSECKIEVWFQFHQNEAYAEH